MLDTVAKQSQKTVRSSQTTNQKLPEISRQDLDVNSDRTIQEKKKKTNQQKLVYISAFYTLSLFKKFE